MDTHELIARIRGSSVDAATLEAVGLTVDRLCSEYPHRPAGDLLTESRRWLERVAELRDHRVTLAQHREILTQTGWLALLVGCLEIARSLAEDVVRITTDKPMRRAEAHITLAVVSSHEGDLEQAFHHGRMALSPQRRSLPSLNLLTDELRGVLVDRFGAEPAVRAYGAELGALE